MSRLPWPVCLLVVALLSVGPIACGSASKALVVTGESLDAVGRQFIQVHTLYNQLLSQHLITDEAYARWKQFGMRFQAAYPLAVDSWKLARATREPLAQSQAERALRDLANDLGAFQGEAYQWLHPSTRSPQAVRP